MFKLSVYNASILRKSDNSLFKYKDNNTMIINKIETLKTIHLKNNSLIKDNSAAEKNIKINMSNNNKSIADEYGKAISNEKTYVKKIIRDKKLKIDLNVKDNSYKQIEDKNDQLYKLKRPLNINLGTKKNEYISNSKDGKKDGSPGKTKNLREIKKTLINNISQIHKKTNISEINNYSIVNNTNYNNSFLYFQPTISKNVDKNKSRQGSTSIIKQGSFEQNMKDLNFRKSELSASKYNGSKLNNSNNVKDDVKNFGKINILEKIETICNRGNVKKNTINLNGSVLKKLSNKKSLNINLKNIHIVEVNRKLSNINV